MSGSIRSLCPSAENVPKPRPKLTRNKKACSDDVDKEILTAIREASSKPESKSTKDEAELYALSLVPVLRRLTPYKLAYLKTKLSTLLLDVEFNLPEPSLIHRQPSSVLMRAQMPTYMSQLSDRRVQSNDSSDFFNPISCVASGLDSDQNYTYSRADLIHAAYTSDSA